MAVFLALAAIAATGGSVPRPPVIRDGCQGELCSDMGTWIVSAPVELYAKPNSSRQIAILRKGTYLKALGGIVVTTRVGTGVLTQPYEDHDSYGRLTVQVGKGTRIYILSGIAEGVVVARTLDGRELTVDDSEYEATSECIAHDWVRVRLPNGRIGWVEHDDDADFDCSSLFDDRERCEALGAGPG
jgi:hypothetical protein